MIVRQAWMALCITLALASSVIQAQRFSQATAERYAEYSFAAYCGINDISDWQCPYCSDPDFQPLYMNYDKPSKNAVYIGVNDKFQEIVVSFRGTVFHLLTDWVDDLKIWRSSASFFGKDISVHSGFLDLYSIHRQNVVDYVLQCLYDYPGYKVRLTGHSLGGALATVMALDLAQNYNLKNLQVMTFGSPRVGNFEFAQAFNESGIQHFRVVSGYDIVPHFPQMLFGFHHAPEEVWQLSSGDDALSFLQCNLSGEDPNCSLSVKSTLYSLSDHSNYLGVPSKHVCSGDQDPTM